MHGKFVICSDSLGAIEAIKNTQNNNMYPALIRSILTKHYPKFKILWTPGHCNIKGNEMADKAAKLALNMPLIYTQNLSTKDINKFLKQQLNETKKNILVKCNNWYQNINTNDTHTSFYSNVTQQQIARLDQIKFTRLRLGHTNLTHKYYLDRTTPQSCPICLTHSPINMDHILNSCPAIAQTKLNILNNINAIQYLRNPSIENI